MASKPARFVNASDLPDAGPHHRMLDGITAAEDDYLQRQANGLMRRICERRIKSPAKTMARLRSALRAAGLIRIRTTWLGCSSVRVDAIVGRKLKAQLLAAEAHSADKICRDTFYRASRRIGLKPVIEDVYIRLDGQAVEGAVNTVPFAVTSKAVARMVDLWRGRGHVMP